MPTTEQDFEAQVLKGVETVTSKVDKLTQDYDRLDKDTKKSFEDLTALKKVANDSQANLIAVQRTLAEIDAKLRKQALAAFGDPMVRISRDDELRWRLNLAVRHAIDKDGDVFKPAIRKAPEDLVKKALGEDSSPGSTLINTALANEIYDTLSSYGVWNTFGVRRLGTKITTYPVKTARPVAGFILTEGDTISDDSNKAGTSVNLEAEVLAVLLNVSQQLLQDAEFDVTQDILGDFAEALAYRLDWACLQADGTSDSTDGAMTGVFGGAATAAVAASGNTTVESLDLEDFTRAVLAVDEGVLTRPCRWWMNRRHLIRTLSIKDNQGRPLFLTATEAPSPGIGSILGYPITLASAAPSTNTAGSKIAVFGDPAGLVVGIRQDFTMEASDHHKWNTLQRSFRAYGRAGVIMRRSTAMSCLTLASS